MSAPRLVLVAHEDATIRDSAVQVARNAGHAAVGVGDGESARLLVASPLAPAVAVVDVALPGMLAYELVDEIAAEGLPTRVVLIASVYSKTAYKRRPVTLYGAYDYVEQHHIVDGLPGILERAIADAAPPGDRPATADLEVGNGDAIREAGEARLSFRYDTRAEGTVRARRLARLIVADVVLYCGREVGDWIDAGAPDVLPPTLARDVAEGRRLFDLRVPREIRDQADFIDEALRDFARRRA